MNAVPELKTSRCVLKQIADEDLPLLFQIMIDEQSKQFLPELFDLVKTEDGLHQFISSFDLYLSQNEGILWGIYNNESYMGFIAIMDIHNDSAIFYALHPLYRKNGYMKECLEGIVNFLFSNGLCDYLQTEVYENNFASLKILYANGFEEVKREGDKLYLKKVQMSK